MSSPRRLLRGTGLAGVLALAVLGVPVVAPPLSAAAPLAASPATEGDGASLDSLSLYTDNVSILNRLSVNVTTGANLVSESGSGIGVAVLDSGVTETPGLTGRVVQGADFTGQGLADQFGHGTFVAGLVAGDGTGQDGRNTGIKGLAPKAKIISVKVADSQGRATVGSLAQGLIWVLQNKDRYNIRVVNLSLSVDQKSSYLSGPLNALVEALWYQGVVVVTSAGNDGSAVNSAPGNDPLVITVGSTYDKNTLLTVDDKVSSYSNRGKNMDGLDKPELTAPGEHVQSTVPAGSLLASKMTVKGLPAGYGQLSGTSMSAGVVSGEVADLLSRKPTLTPDKVKGILLASRGTNRGVQVPNLMLHLTAPAANVGVKPSIALAVAYANLVLGTSDYASIDWDSVDWSSVAWDDATWTNATWTNATWTNATWTNATWTNSGWTVTGEANATWTNATWTNATWTSATWTSDNGDNS